MEVIFVDTNILIEYLKGDRKLVDQIRFNNICISDIVLMELYQGARNKNDLNYIKKSLENISVVATDNDIISLAKNILEAYNTILKYMIVSLQQRYLFMIFHY